MLNRRDFLRRLLAAVPAVLAADKLLDTWTDSTKPLEVPGVWAGQLLLGPPTVMAKLTGPAELVSFGAAFDRAPEEIEVPRPVTLWLASHGPEWPHRVWMQVVMWPQTLFVHHFCPDGGILIPEGGEVQLSAGDAMANQYGVAWMLDRLKMDARPTP